MNGSLRIVESVMQRLGILLLVVAAVLSPSYLFAQSSGFNCMMAASCDNGCMARPTYQCAQPTSGCLTGTPGCIDCACLYSVATDSCGCYLN